MDSGVVIQHWLVAVVGAAALEGADALSISSDTETPDAWDLAALATGEGHQELASRVACHYGLAVADLAQAEPHAHRLLPGRIARRLGVLPLRYSDRSLTVATSDPVSFDAEREISNVAGRAVHFEVAAPPALAEAVAATYADEDGGAMHELPPLEQEARGGPRILVVDDDADLRALLRAALEGAGFRVEEAPDGPTALEVVDDTADPYALVTLDLQMPGMDGAGVLRTLRGRMATASLPVVVATGSDDPDTEIALFEAGADDFVVKPVDPTRFILRIQAVLRRHLRATGGPV